MSHSLAIEAVEWEALRSHLLSSDVEQVAFLFARYANAAKDGIGFQVVSWYSCDPADFEVQSDCYFELKAETHHRAIKFAWDRGVALIECHSHVGSLSQAAFSITDLQGLSEFVPHVRWRLRGAPYIALVLATDGIDGLVWARSHEEPEPLALVKAGEIELRTTGRTIGSGRYVRTSAIPSQLEGTTDREAERATIVLHVRSASSVPTGSSE